MLVGVRALSTPTRPAYAPVVTRAVERPPASYSAKISPRTRHAFAPSSSALLTSWAQAARVFQSAQPRPRALSDGQPIPERVTAVGGEQRPGDRQVAGRIADAARPEVDDGRQPPIDEQEIPRGDVTVEPVRDPIPARVQGSSPDLPGQVDVDVARQCRERVLGRLVVG